MSILDIDVDFFLDKVSTSVGAGERLSSEEYSVWDVCEIRKFLRRALQNDETARVPAIVCERHDEVYHLCRIMQKNGLMDKSPWWIHVDAHDDVHGDSDVLIEEASKLEYKEGYAITAKIESTFDVREDNFLAYLILMKMIGSLDYIGLPGSDFVAHPYLGENRESIGIPVFPDGSIDWVITKPAEELYRMMFGESQNRFTEIHRIADCIPGGRRIPFYQSNYQTYDYSRFENKRIDLAFLVKSPEYTPPSSDCLFGEVFEEFFDFAEGEAMKNKAMADVSG